MNKNPENPEPDALSSAAAAGDPRKRYEKPAFVREQLFETMALACGKISPTTGLCRFVRKNS
jgi:hypothetical protein